MATQGTVAGAEKHFTKCARDLGTMTESELLQRFELNEKVEKTIFIADTPGMGKSQVLLSLAQKLVKFYSDKFTLFVNMTEFLERIQNCLESGSADVKKQNVISAVLSLCCSNLFEEGLLENWLLGESESVTCDIMLYGLDEVPIRMRDLAIKTLKMFQQEFPSVRTWTTVRDHMLEYLQVKFRSLGYKLEPFTTQDQIDFLERHWQGYMKSFAQTVPNISSSDLRKFAQKCIHLPLSEQETEIAGIPLNCRMIAEIHESKLLEDNFSSEKDMQVDNKNSLIDLYDQLIERKLQVYLREKSNLLHLKMNHHISNVLRNDLHNSHVYFALKLVFSESNATANEFSTLLFTEKSSMEDISLSVLDQGIIQCLAPLSFNHRTVAEYFVALFVYNVLTGNYLHIHKGDEKFQHFLWNHVLAAHSGMYGREEFKHPAVCQFLNNMWEQFAPPELVSPDIKKLLGVLLRYDNFLKLQSRYAPIYVAKRYENMFALIVLESPRTLSLFYLDILGSRMIGYSQAMFVEMVDIWIDVCHTLRQYDEKKYSLLHLFVLAILRFPSAEMCKEMDKVRYILKHAMQKDPSLVEIRDVHGNTPILLLLRKAEEIEQNNERYLKQNGKYVLNMVKFFVTELNSDVNVTDSHNNSVLHVRNVHGSYSAYNLFQLLLLRLKLLQFFMENGCNQDTVNFVNDKGETPFVSILNSFGVQWNKKQAAGSVFVGVLNAFRKYEANFNEKDKNGNTTLLVAIQQGFGLEFVQKIVNGGADIFAVNGRGQCVLHGAIEAGNLDLVKWLVNKNPNWLHARDKRRNTVYQYDVSQEIRQYLEEMKPMGMRPTEIVFHEGGSTIEIIRKRNQ